MKDLSKERHKESLELHWNGGGQLFLNLWDWAHGRDVVAEIIDGKIMLNERDEDAEPLPVKEITFPEFLELVKKSIESRTV